MVSDETTLRYLSGEMYLVYMYCTLKKNNISKIHVVFKEGRPSSSFSEVFSDQIYLKSPPHVRGEMGLEQLIAVLLTTPFPPYLVGGLQGHQLIYLHV